MSVISMKIDRLHRKTPYFELNICSIYVIMLLCNRNESGCDFPIVRCPLVIQRRGCP